MTKEIECYMCHKKLDPKTLKCKGCGLVYKKTIDKSTNEEILEMDTKNPDTLKAMEKYEQI